MGLLAWPAFEHITSLTLASLRSPVAAAWAQALLTVAAVAGSTWLWGKQKRWEKQQAAEREMVNDMLLASASTAEVGIVQTLLANYEETFEHAEQYHRKALTPVARFETLYGLKEIRAMTDALKNLEGCSFDIQNDAIAAKTWARRLEYSLSQASSSADGGATLALVPLASLKGARSAIAGLRSRVVPLARALEQRYVGRRVHG